MKKPTSLEVPEPKVGASDLGSLNCSICYSPDVHAICHHCEQPICTTCERRPIGWRLVNYDFAWLRPLISPHLRQTVHCPEHAHREWSMLSLWVLVSLLLLIVVLLFSWSSRNWRLGFSIWFIGTSLFGLLSWLAPHILSRNREYRYGFPIFSKVTVELAETISVNIHVGENQYLSGEEIATGELKAKIALKPGDFAFY